jgi:uncharacterized membrane protein SirB2
MVDTVVLISAIVLTVLVHQYPFVQAWLTVKLLLLVAYIVLGTIATKRGKTKAQRIAAFIAAILVFGFIYSVARTHNPLGVSRLRSRKRIHPKIRGSLA